MNIKIITLLIFASFYFAMQYQDPNCLTYEENICTSCNTDKFYFLQNDVCRKYIGLYCSKINNFGLCEQCEPEFFLSQAGECIFISQRIESCETYSEKERVVSCAVCKNGFRLTMGFCFRRIPNCERYMNSGRNRCVICASGFILKNSLCVDAQEN